MRRLLSSAVFCVLAVLSFAPTMSAQSASNNFSLQGTVVDATGAAVVGARASAVADGQTSASVATTNQRGVFTLSLPPGSYTVTIEAGGFVELQQTVRAVASGSDTRQIVLEVAGLSEAVNVNAPAGYNVPVITSATKTPTPLIDTPQSITVVSKELMADTLMDSITDVVQYIPGIAEHQGENNRDEVIIRGNDSSSNFFLNTVRDDVQYYRDLYNVERIEALKGPNATMFGRGGGGGVINRVSKEAGFNALAGGTVQFGAYDNRRFTGDVDRAVNDKVAFRVNGVYENSGSFRDGVDLERGGVAPTVTFAASDKTRITVSDEYLHDTRVADRGITSYQGRPADVPITTYYGNSDNSNVHANVNLLSGLVEHRSGSWTIRNRTMLGNYDRGYQNYVPGAVTADKSQVALTAYNNATTRSNLFNQTDAVYVGTMGHIHHTLLTGAEIGQQLTDNFRNTGYFNNLTTSILVPYANPSITTPVTFRQSATDADNHLRTNLGALYVQEQIELTSQVQVIAGLRGDRFDLTYHNNRNGDTIGRIDNLLSPRAGLVVKPVNQVSLYGTYTVSYLPSSGDQFSSLTVITQALEPEKFTNYEVGAKWDAVPQLSITTALYRLDRTNTRSTDPNNPTLIVQTGSQRTNGYELGATGHLTREWSVAGGYAFQNAFVTSATAAAPLGAIVGQVPRNTFSLWNRYQATSKLAGGVGIIYRSDMFATIDNTVTLPGYTRIDAAGFYALTAGLRLQVNVENLFNTTYYLNSDSNTNISPGSPRAARVALAMRF